MRSLARKLRKSDFLGGIFHTLDYCLKRELAGSETVLDLGSGPSSPLKDVKNIKHSVGVESFVPYLEQSKRDKTHHEYINKRIEDLDFPEDSFDSVIMIEVLEHMEKEIGIKVLQKAERWARKKIIISTPNGFFPMEAVDGNEFQRHLSGWDVDDFQKNGFRVSGLGGAKLFYVSGNKVKTLSGKEEAFSNMRFWPRTIFYVINAFSQIITYYLPKHSFGLLAVKTKKRCTR